MKAVKIVFFLFCFFLLRECLADETWHQVDGDHFMVYFTQDEKFAKQILDKAEDYYRDIASDLGYPRYSEFWTWEKRVKIYIYPDRASYIRATGQPEWSQGMADYTNKRINSFIASESFINSILPHEIGHLIFRDFVGFRGEVPLWLDEGVAQWGEELKRSAIKAMVKKLYEEDSLLSLTDMMKLDVRNVTSNDKVYIRPSNTKDGDKGVLFLSGDNLVRTYYLQSVSLVGFLIERYGSVDFAEFCRQLREGKSMDDALRAAYPAQITSISELEEKWRAYLAK